MTVKELISQLERCNLDIEVVSAYGSGEYVMPQFRYADIYRRSDPSYIVPSYSDRRDGTTDSRSISALILGLA